MRYLGVVNLQREKDLRVFPAGIRTVCILQEPTHEMICELIAYGWSWA